MQVASGFSGEKEVRNEVAIKNNVREKGKGTGSPGQDLEVGGTSTFDIYTPVFRHGVKLPTLAELDLQQPREIGLKTFCSKPGCNMVETTRFTPEKLVGHNWLHTEGSRYFDDNPKYQWLYDLEAGYFFDGIVALWHVLGGEDDKKEKKQQVIQHLWQYGLEAAPEYASLEPSYIGAEFLYGRCFVHRENSKILCVEGGCKAGGSVWAIVESLIGRVDVPRMGRVTSLRPEPVTRMEDLRFAAPNRMGAAESLINIVGN